MNEFRFKFVDDRSNREHGNLFDKDHMTSVKHFNEFYNIRIKTIGGLNPETSLFKLTRCYELYKRRQVK